MEGDLSLRPINFFQIFLESRFLPAPEGKAFALNSANYSDYLLPDLSKMNGEYAFASLALVWNFLGLELLAIVDKPYEKSFYPGLEQGDSLEVCVDTRNVKTSGYNTRFCHHFFALPSPVNGIEAGEITRFRTEDAHELCDHKALVVASQSQKNQYLLHFFIPALCMHGYDPEQFDQIGFSYRLNRVSGPPQHFSVHSKEYVWEQQPSLWSSVKLVK